MVRIAHPIIGDVEHGDTKLNRRYQDHAGVTHLMLAAVRVEFVHPVTGISTVIDCAPAKSFAVVIERLRLLSMNHVGEHGDVAAKKE